ncbi:peptidoglycan DD-metalloendopeptidase family protein [Patescibacteria group bacterium]|nr:peptidoglycan DD-metalloendopeptidase family protein [Patescibacteria group bacterium]
MKVQTVWKQRRLDSYRGYIKIAAIGIIVIVFLLLVIFIPKLFKTTDIIADDIVIANEDTKVVVEISTGDTYGIIMENNSVPISIANDIYNKSLEYYDLVTLRAGKKLDLYYDGDTGDIIRLEYKIDSEDELIVAKDLSEAGEGNWSAIRQAIAYEVKERVVSGEVKSSMYQAALENDIDERAIIEFANAFQWSIDFAMDPRVGDIFKFAFEERYLDGEYIMPGKILAGRYVNAGENYELFYFEESEENKGYFDIDGNSVQKMFLKAPVAFKYISSGFTTGSRYVAAFNVSTGHRAIDYATPYGTPIRTVGDGTVVFAGWSSAGYGYLTSIRHNGTYTTNYAHQSRIAVGYGQKVKQGEVIGYVGSTGFSTGPHLHYEMVKNGVKINPMYEVLPPGKPILEENRERFEQTISRLIDMLE